MEIASVFHMLCPSVFTNTSILGPSQEGLFWLTVQRVHALWLELEAVDHVTSSVRNWRNGRSSISHLTVSFAFRLGLQPMGWCHHSQVGSSQEPDLEASSQTNAAVSLISDFRCCEVGALSV